MQSQVDETRISAKIMLKLSGGASRTIHRLGQAPARIWTSEKRSAELTHPLKGRSRSLHLICAGLSLAMSDYHAAQHTFAHVQCAPYHSSSSSGPTSPSYGPCARAPASPPSPRFEGDMSPIDSSVRSSCAFWKRPVLPWCAWTLHRVGTISPHPCPLRHASARASNALPSDTAHRAH